MSAPLAQGFVEDELPLARRLAQQLQQFRQRALVKVLAKPRP